MDWDTMIMYYDYYDECVYEGIEPKNFWDWCYEGDNSLSCFFLMLNIKNLPFTKIPTYVIIYTFPEGSNQK